MDILDYTESVSAKSLEVARRAYDDLHERSYKLAALLVAGGGAVGAYALGKFIPGSAPIAWAPLAALAVSWSGIALHLIIKGATSRPLSPGNGPKNLRSYFNARLAENASNFELALEATRHAELDLVQIRLRAYSDGCTARANAIDVAYWAVALCSPTVPLIVAGICAGIGN